MGLRRVRRLLAAEHFGDDSVRVSSDGVISNRELLCTMRVFFVLSLKALLLALRFCEIRDPTAVTSRTAHTPGVKPDRS